MGEITHYTPDSPEWAFRAVAMINERDKRIVELEARYNKLEARYNALREAVLLIADAVGEK